MTDALILACGTGLNDESLKDYPSLFIGGLTQLRRLVRSCVKVGIRDITVVSDMSESAVKEMVPESLSGEAKITVASPGKTVCGRACKVLVLQSNLFVQRQLLESFLSEKPPSGGAVFMKCSEEDSGGLMHSKTLGAVIVEPEAVADLVEDCDLSRWVGRYREEGMREYEVPASLYAMNLGTDSGVVEKARRLLFSSVGKTATGWIARNINGRLSLPISSLLVKTSLTPNQVSFLTNIAAGVPCILSYLTGHPVLGAVFMQIAAVLDRCDGEVARLKLMETKRGEWVDTISDQITVAGFVISVPVGYYLHGAHQSLAVFMGAVNISVFLFFLIWSFFFMVRYTGSGSLVSYHRIDELVNTKKVSPARKLLAFLRPVMRRNFYSLAFVFFAIFGGYVWVLGVTTLGLAGIFVHQIEDIFRLKDRIFRKDFKSV